MFCRVCDSKRLEPVIDLKKQPWANDFIRAEEIGKESYYPLRVVYCCDCETAQLDYTVKKEIMFANHTYLSGVTNTLNHHFELTAQNVTKQFFSETKSNFVLDIGSNDGTQLKHYKNLGYNVLGVEPSTGIAGIANENGIPTLNDFFNLELAKEINQKFDVINASGVFFHLEELHSVTAGIKESLKSNGVFVVQFLYMKKIMENLAFDQIYHEHLLYYNLQTIEVLLNRHGLALFDAYVSPIHGGSVIGFITHTGQRKRSEQLIKLFEIENEDKCNDINTYYNFAKRIEGMKTKTLGYLEDAKKRNRTIFGFGAPVKGNTLLNYFKIGTQYIECLVEKNLLRKDLYSPGMHIPIVMEDELTNLPDIYFVLAWNFKKEILANNQHLIDQGVEFYFPVNPKE